MPKYDKVTKKNYLEEGDKQMQAILDREAKQRADWQAQNSATGQTAPSNVNNNSVSKISAPQQAGGAIRQGTTTGATAASIGGGVSKEVGAASGAGGKGGPDIGSIAKGTEGLANIAAGGENDATPEQKKENEQKLGQGAVKAAATYVGGPKGADIVNKAESAPIVGGRVKKAEQKVGKKLRPAAEKVGSAIKRMPGGDRVMGGIGKISGMIGGGKKSQGVAEGKANDRETSEQLRRARPKQAVAGASEEAASGAAGQAVQVATSSLLKGAWLSLIPSFGLTLIYLNLHPLIAAMLPGSVGKSFCKLGDEWLPPAVQKMAGSKIGRYVEPAALLALDLLVLALILAILVLIKIIVDFATASNLDKARMIGEFYGSYFSALGDLFDYVVTPKK